MSAWWIVCVVVFILISSVNSRFELDTPIRIARCRASCLYKMTEPPDTDDMCKNSSFCSQCWQSCGVLHTSSVAKLHCKSRECGPGCLEACRFHSLSSTLVAPSPPEEVLSLSPPQVSWPPLPGAVVYVVMVDGSQLRHTLQPRVTLPSTADPATVRVLAVDWRGQVRVLAPVAESPVDRAMHVLRSLGLEAAQSREFVKGVTILEDPDKPIKIDNSWNVSLLSLQRQPSLVLAQIGWESYHHKLLKRNQQTTGGQLMNSSQLIVSYLVTWAADGDVVRGNLLTNTSVVTLSLWPDTTYTIQVALFSLRPPTIQSQPLTLDTHQAEPQVTPARLPEPDVLVGHPVVKESRGRVGGGAGREAVAGVAAAVLAFLGVVLTATWRWRHRLNLPHNKLIDEECDAPNLYRVFPPAMRLLADTDPSAEVFSSKDNLLQDQ